MILADFLQSDQNETDPNGSGSETLEESKRKSINKIGNTEREGRHKNLIIKQTEAQE